MNPLITHLERVSYAYSSFNGAKRDGISVAASRAAFKPGGLQAAVIAGLTLWVSQPSHAQVLTFEGLKNLEPVANFYNGGLGGNGSGPGPNYGITFGSGAVAKIESSAGGTGNFGGEPSPVTAITFLSGPGAVLDDPAGIVKGFSFFYSAPFYTGFVNVYSGLDGTGALLATLSLPTTPLGPSGKQYDPFLPAGISFSGVAKSVNFSGTADYIGFDNITLGSSIPQGGTPGAVPEASSLTLLGAGGIGLFLLVCRRRRA